MSRKCVWGMLRVLLLAGVMVPGFATGATEQTAAPEETAAVPAGKYGEAPMLAALVAAGELPPVDDRLPANPFVREVEQEIGTYGGTWYRTTRAASPVGGPGIPGYRQLDKLMIIDYWEARVYPVHVEALQMQDNANTWTFDMREGLRWSDGAPFTSADIMFWWNDAVRNEKVTPKLPSYWMVGGEAARVSQVDDYTVRFEFDGPFPLFDRIAAVRGEVMARYPKHYLSQFHEDYADQEELAGKVKEAGFETWFELFTHHANQTWQRVPDPEKPTLHAWAPVSVPSMGPLVFERNPYYGVVDQARNQLPYIDQVVIELVSDIQTMNLRAIAGELDAQRIFGKEIWSDLMELDRAGELQAWGWPGPNHTGLDLAFNLTDDDPGLREVFQDKRFRIAVSHAINREEINRIAYFGFSWPVQSGPKPGEPFYHAELKSAYIEYDRDTANGLLDEMGLTGRDRDGYRLRGDGETLEFVLMNSRGDLISQDVMELLSDYLAAVGVKTIIRWGDSNWDKLETGDWNAFVGAGHHTGSIYTGDQIGGHYVPWARSADTSYPGYWAGEWSRWLASDGTRGEQPPPLIKQLYDLNEQMKSAITEQERKAIAKQIFDIALDNLWVIGIVAHPGEFFVAATKFGNVAPQGERIMYDVRVKADQFFIKQQ